MRAYRQAKRRVLRARDFQKISFLFVNKQNKQKRERQDHWRKNGHQIREQIDSLLHGSCRVKDISFNILLSQNYQHSANVLSVFTVKDARGIQAVWTQYYLRFIFPQKKKEPNKYANKFQKSTQIIQKKNYSYSNHCWLMCNLKIITLSEQF